MQEAIHKKKILVTGAAGQLGSELRELSGLFPQYHFLFTGKHELDITDKDAVNLFFSEHIISTCINCAAYTAVDKAEQEKERATAINASAPGFLAKACKKNNAAFIHISTDYVFNGTAEKPYRPEDKTDPVNFYGFTKLEGEQNVSAENKDAIIIRTAWVYSSYGNNFVKTMLRLMKEKESIGVVADQKGTPTYAADLAAAIMLIVDNKNLIPGIYHYTDNGTTTWYGFAKEIAALTRSACIINPLTTDQYPTPAKRPARSVLDKEKIIRTFHVIVPEWRESLKKCIVKLS